MNWRIAIAAVVVLGCVETCPRPAAITYSQAPLDGGGVGCSGTPSTYRDRATVPDPMAVFPVGTTITFPFCHPFYPNSNATCSCTGNTLGDAGPSTGMAQWICPL